jgi:excisionase family DNA binding protein
MKSTPVELFTMKETCAMLKCSRTTLWKIRKAGAIQELAVGKKRVFSKTAIINYLSKPLNANSRG